MKLLLVSDIHGNIDAMEACLAAAPEHDAVANLGDIVGYGAAPNEVVERSRSLASAAKDAVWVRGNHDKACSGVSNMEDFNLIAFQAAMWTRGQLKPDNLQFTKDLPQGPMRPEKVAGATLSKHGIVQFVHGSPLDEDEYMFVMRDAYQPLSTTDAFITFFGHTHIQGGFCVNEDEWFTLRPAYETREELETSVLKFTPGAKYLINPGSIGQPRDADWRAAFAVYDTEADEITFYRVPYPIAKAQQRIYDASLPERLATRLADGR